MKLDNKKLSVVTSLIITVILIITLFVLRIGVADNGNLQYVLEDIGIYDHQSTAGSGLYADGFGVKDKSFSADTGGLVYSLVKLLFPVDSVMYVWIPALIYMIMFALGIFLFLRSMLGDNKTTNILMCILMAIIIADSGYTALFNTPYTEGAFIAYLALFAGLYVSAAKTGKMRYLILTGIIGMLFGASSVYASVTGVLLGASLLSFIKGADVKRKIVSVTVALLVILSSFYGFTVEKSSDAMKYNRVFYGILSISENDEQSLIDLGLNKEFAEYADIASFDEKAQSFMKTQEFNLVKEKASFSSVAKYYITHGSEFLKAVKASLNNGTMIKSSYLGDYPVSSGKAGQISKFWTLYSSIKPKVIPLTLPVLLVLAAGVVILSLSYKSKHKEKKGTGNVVCLLIALTVGCVLTLPAAVFQNGLSMIDFNMRSFNFIFDTVLFGAITGGVNMMLSRQQELREKYGVNQ